MLKVTPVGSAPDSLSDGDRKAGGGNGEASLPCPTVKVALDALVMAATWFTVSVKFCVALVPMPLWAVKVMGKVPLTVGVPARTPVAVLKVTPAGRAPDSEAYGAGKPVAVTVNEPAVVMLNVESKRW